MKRFAIEFRWAIIFSMAMVLWMAGEKAVGLHDVYVGEQVLYTNLFGFVAIPIYALALKDKKKNFYNGNANWTQLFLSGVVVAVMVAALSPLVQAIIFNVISKDFISNISQYYVSNKIMTADKAATYFSFRSYIIQGVSNGISTGVIISSVAALFIRTKIKTETK